MIKTNIELTQDEEMLEEYDFREGVRGKYYQKYQNSNLKPLTGIKFVTDTKGRKTGVLIELNEHQNIWNDCINKYPDSVNVEYLINSQGDRTAVFISFPEQLSLWSMIYDTIISELM